VQVLEQALHVGRKVQRVGNDDDIEFSLIGVRLSEVQQFTCLHMKPPFRHALPRRGDLRGSKIDPYFSRRVDLRQQFARTAADFQHAAIRRNEQVVVVRELRAISAGARLRLRRRRIIERADALEVFTGKDGNIRRHVGGWAREEWNFGEVGAFAHRGSRLMDCNHPRFTAL
jgi:hypothetical protein